MHSSFQSQIVYFDSETSSIQWKSKHRNVWGQKKHVSTLWRCLVLSGCLHQPSICTASQAMLCENQSLTVCVRLRWCLIWLECLEGAHKAAMLLCLLCIQPFEICCIHSKPCQHIVQTFRPGLCTCLLRARV